jgi:hypothetical protein
MSANNYILIKKEEDLFVVTERDADTDSPYSVLGKFKSLNEAIDEANKRLQGEDPYDWYPVEYGLSIHPSCTE